MLEDTICTIKDNLVHLPFYLQILIRPDAKDVESAHELGYNHAAGPALFDELMQEMADEVLEISSASARRLYNAIVEGFQEEDDYNTNLKPIHSLGGLIVDNTKAKSDELIASRVAVGETTGNCHRSGVKLKLINLEKPERKQLHSSLIELSKTRFEEFSRGNHSNADYAEKHLNTFADWLK